jgi:hypothetical protein
VFAIMSARLVYRVLVPVLLLVCSSPACRRHDPPPLVAKNLGTQERPLLPTARRTYDPSILKGKASPVPFDDLAADQAERGDVVEGEISDDDRELVEELVELTVTALAEGRFDDTLELLVPEQREAAGKLVEEVKKIGQVSEAFGTVLNEKMPGAAEGMLRGLPGLGLGIPGLPTGGATGPPNAEQWLEMFQVTDLQMVADDKAAGSISFMAQKAPLEFRLIDDEWFLQIPRIFDDPEIVDALVTAFGVVEEQLGDLTLRVEQGEIGPESLLPELMKMGQALMPAFQEVAAKLGHELPAPPGADTETGEPVEEEEEEAEGDEAEEEEEAEPETPPPSRGRGRLDGIG